jgi:hypothetical protein
VEKGPDLVIRALKGKKVTKAIRECVARRMIFGWIRKDKKKGLRRKTRGDQEFTNAGCKNSGFF